LGCLDGAGEAEEVIRVASTKSEFLDQALGIMGPLEKDDDGVSKVLLSDEVRHEV